MRSLISHSPSHGLGALAARMVGVVLLTPLILLAGLVAVVALTAFGVSRHPRLRKPVRRPARAPAAVMARSLVLRLEPVPGESGMTVRRAA